MTVHEIARSDGSPSSSGVTSTGPVGQNVSSDLPRTHWPSPNWRSRAETSFKQVKPSTDPRASAIEMFRVRRPITTAELGLIVHLRCQARVPDDLGPRADHRARPLGEDQRLGWRWIPALLERVVGVVAADRHDLARPRDRRQEINLVEWGPVSSDTMGVGRGAKCRQGDGPAREERLDRRRGIRPEVDGRHQAIARDDPEQRVCPPRTVRREPHAIRRTS